MAKLIGLHLPKHSDIETSAERIKESNFDASWRVIDAGFALPPSDDAIYWWLLDDVKPTFADAKRRAAHHAEYGNTAYAFSSGRSFNATQAISHANESQFLLRLADDALIHSQRISEWCGHGPVLEEDLALGNIALDYLGQARLLYSHIGQTEGRSRGEDELAYFRNDDEFFNSSLVELPNSSGFGERDYSITIAKLFLHSSFMLLKWRVLTNSTNPVLAAVAAKSMKECRYHFDHSTLWVKRFGDGTVESKARITNALTYLWPYTNEWFEDDLVDEYAHTQQLGALNSGLKDAWQNLVAPILLEATLTKPEETRFLSQGKHGTHSESLSLLLAEMQSLARQHPGATW
jgi:ring-1,2-phenylacetyl-CoA epoxidase subunit PaaC